MRRHLGLLVWRLQPSFHTCRLKSVTSVYSINSLLILLILWMTKIFQSPLGLTVGNSLEVEESLACLRGGGPPDLRELVILPVFFHQMNRMMSMGNECWNGITLLKIPGRANNNNSNIISTIGCSILHLGDPSNPIQSIRPSTYSTTMIHPSQTCY